MLTTANQSSVKEVRPCSLLSIPNPTLTALGWKPILLSKRLETKRLTHDTIRQQLAIRYDMQHYATFKTNFHTHTKIAQVLERAKTSIVNCVLRYCRSHH